MDMKKLLIKYGCDINKSDKNGITPLQIAKSKRNNGIIEIIEIINFLM